MALPVIPVGQTRVMASLGNEQPNPEARMPVPGAADDASRADHQHPRLTSSTTHTTGTNGKATVAFTRVFSMPPAISICALDYVDNTPPNFVVESWLKDANGQYSGCVVRGYKGMLLPATILLLANLTNFNVFSAPASGIKFSCLAVMPSTPT